MKAIDDDFATPTSQTSMVIRWAISGCLTVVMLGLIVVAFLGFQVEQSLQSHAREIPPRDVERMVAFFLISRGIFGPNDPSQPGYADQQTALEWRIRAVQGTSESSGFNGDGTSWYEVDLAPDLADELRRKFARSPTTREAVSGADIERATPNWWPRTWPPGSIVSRVDFVSFTQPPTGTRFWVRFVRI